MHCNFLAIALATTYVTVSAQSAEGLPNCAVICILEALAETTCASTDFACACEKATALTPSIEPCARKACSTADYEALPDSLDKFCAASNVTISVTNSDSVLGADPITTPVWAWTSGSLTSSTSSMAVTTTSSQMAAAAAAQISASSQTSSNGPVQTANAANINSINLVAALAAIAVVVL